MAQRISPRDKGSLCAITKSLVHLGTASPSAYCQKEKQPCTVENRESENLLESIGGLEYFYVNRYVNRADGLKTRVYIEARFYQRRLVKSKRMMASDGIL